LISSAQERDCTGSLSGVVLDEHDNASLGYATIYIIELERGTVADSLGNFIINELCQGQYTVRFSHIGCETKEQVVRVQGHTRLTLRLEHHAELLQTIELQATRVREVGSAARAELDRDVQLQSTGYSLGQLLEKLPGVTALQTGPAVFKPIIHGLHSQRILILKNGLRLESQQWGLDHAPEITAHTASRVSVVKGTAAVQYGSDAIAGVILIEPEELPSTDTLSGDIQLTGIDNGRQFALTGMVSKGFNQGFGIRLLGGIRRAGDAKAADYLLTNTGFAEGNIELEAGHRKGLNFTTATYRLFAAENGILRSAHIGNLTDLEEALQRDRPLIVEEFSYDVENPKQHVLHHTIQLSAQRFKEKIGVFNGMYAIQWNGREEYDIRRGGRDDLPALDLLLQTHTGLLSLSHPHSERLHGKLGLHWTWQQNRNVPGTGVRPLLPNYTRYVPAVSWVEKWINAQSEIEAGLRYEYVGLQVKRINAQNQLEKPEFTFHNLSGFAGYRGAISEATSVYTHIGATQRSPHVNELFSEGLHHGAAAIEEGDTSLVPEKAWKWNGGVEIRKSAWQLDALLYLQWVRDFIYLYPAGEPQLTIRGAFPVFNYVQSNVFLSGVDVSLQIQFNANWHFHAEYAIVRAEDTEKNEDLYGMPSDRMRHTVMWISKKETFHADISVEHVRKQTQIQEGIDYAPAPNGYTLLHAGAGIDLMKDRMQLSFAIRNILNVSYREYLNRLRYYADDTGRSIEFRLNYAF
jgi:iron complex outermembrane receptor protein